MTQQTNRAPYVALGLMSGTSLDGVDAALVRTDGETITAFGPTRTFAYDDGFRRRMRSVLGRSDVDAPEIQNLAEELTAHHAEAVAALMSEAPEEWRAVDVVGFHGQTLYHAPADGMTVQIGDGQTLAQSTGLTVVSDFRSADVAAGGQGAPLVPVFHRALVQSLPQSFDYGAGSVAVLNLGGVGNVTVVADTGELLAFDTGPGNALIDDWVVAQTDLSCDLNGDFAAAGEVNEDWLEEALSAPYFAQRPPKSLDRNAFPSLALGQMSLESGAATLTAFTTRSVARVLDFTSLPPAVWVVCGGGRHNSAIMSGLRQAVGAPVVTAEAVGWDGDGLEAQAFGYLAVRVLDGRPTTFPGTTGVAQPQTGGRIDRPSKDRDHKGF